MNRETALRIAMAARALPDISAGQLLDVLYQNIDGDLDEGTLKTITVTQIKAGLSGDDDIDATVPVPALKEAVRILWGEHENSDVPQPQPLENIPEHSIRVAFSSNSGENLDGHFGSCVRFLIYQVSPELQILCDVRSALEADLAEDKNAFRVDLIKDCDVLYIQSIGGPAAARIIKAGVYPLKKSEGGQTQELLNELRTVMSSNPPPWLAKLLGKTAKERVRYMH